MLHVWVLKPFALDQFKTCQNGILHSKPSSRCMQQLCGLFWARNWQICRFPINNKRIECGTMALVVSQSVDCLPTHIKTLPIMLIKSLQVLWASSHIRTRFPNVARAQAKVIEVAEADGAESCKSCRACSSSAWARPSLWIISLCMPILPLDTQDHSSHWGHSLAIRPNSSQFTDAITTPPANW